MTRSWRPCMGIDDAFVFDPQKKVLSQTEASDIVLLNQDTSKFLEDAASICM